MSHAIGPDTIKAFMVIGTICILVGGSSWIFMKIITGEWQDYFKKEQAYSKQK